MTYLICKYICSTDFDFSNKVAITYWYALMYRIFVFTVINIQITLQLQLAIHRIFDKMFVGGDDVKFC